MCKIRFSNILKGAMDSDPPFFVIFWCMICLQSVRKNECDEAKHLPTPYTCILTFIIVLIYIHLYFFILIKFFIQICYKTIFIFVSTILAKSIIFHPKNKETFRLFSRQFLNISISHRKYVPSIFLKGWRKKSKSLKSV